MDSDSWIVSNIFLMGFFDSDGDGAPIGSFFRPLGFLRVAGNLTPVDLYNVLGIGWTRWNVGYDVCDEILLSGIEEPDSFLEFPQRSGDRMIQFEFYLRAIMGG